MEACLETAVLPLRYIAYFEYEKAPIIHDYPWSIPVAGVAFYLIATYLGVQWMKNRAEFKLTGVLRIWNFFLTLLSVVMFLGMAVPIGRIIVAGGFFNFFCPAPPEVWVGTHSFFIWVFSLSKFIELFDTALLILRKRELSFLHVYHHASVLIFTWFCWRSRAAPGYIFGTVNSLVHCFMYYYYFLTTIGYRPRWAMLVTQGQVLQMVVGIFTVAAWSTSFLAGYGCTCMFPTGFMILGVILYGSYLFLFFQFYLGRYAAAKSAAAARKTGKPTEPKEETKAPKRKDAKGTAEPIGETKMTSSPKGTKKTN